MKKKLLLCFNLIIAYILLVGTVSFAADYTIDLYVGESSDTITSASTEYTIQDDTIVSVDATLGAGSTTVYKAGDQDLDSARYTITGTNNNYTVSGNGVYLYLNNRVNYTNSRTLRITNNNNGTFKFAYYANMRSTYLRFANNAFTYGTNNSNNNIYLYEKVGANETGSTEIPGYRNVNTFTAGGQYLLVYPSGGDYYILYPSTSNFTKILTEEVTGEASTYVFNGLKSGTTQATIGGDNYTINVYERLDNNFIDKEVLVGRGETYTLRTNLTNATFTSLNPNIATVNSNGRVTGVAQGETLIKVTTQDGKIYKVPVTVYGTLYTVTVNIDADEHSHVYQSTNYGELSSVGNHETLYFKHPSGVYRVFGIYVAPDEGYAIADAQGIMTVINSDTPSEVRNGIASSFVSGHFNSGHITREQIASQFETALGMGIEELNGYTRDVTFTSDSSDIFIVRTEKLPTIETKIYSINGTPYTDGMTAKPGDVIIYEVELEKTAGEYLMVENGSFSSSLNGATFIGTSPNGDSTPNSVSVNPGQSVDRNYYYRYTVPNNADGRIDNVVTFNYRTYQSPTSGQIHTSYNGNSLSYKVERKTTSSASISVNDKAYIMFDNAVFGNLADVNKYFKFKVELDGVAGDTFEIEGQDATIDYDGQTITTSTTYTVGQENFIYLKDGQNVKITVNSNSTDYIGHRYAITQVDGLDYDTTVNGNNGKTTGNLYLTGTEITYHFVNYKEKSPNTGTFIDYVPYTIMIAIVVVIFNIVTAKNVKKSKRRN